LGDFFAVVQGKNKKKYIKKYFETKGTHEEVRVGWGTPPPEEERRAQEEKTRYEERKKKNQNLNRGNGVIYIEILQAPGTSSQASKKKTSAFACWPPNDPYQIT
jgi:hypothetical protein